MCERGRVVTRTHGERESEERRKRITREVIDLICRHEGNDNVCTSKGVRGITVH